MASGLERRPRDGYRFARPILRADDAQKSHSSFDIARTGKSPTRCPALLAKIFPFPSDPNHFYIVRIPAHTQGAFRDRHERRVGMRWTRVALLTRALSCGRRSRVVPTSRTIFCTLRMHETPARQAFLETCLTNKTARRKWAGR